MKLYINQIPTQDPDSRIILVGDHTPWPRTEAPTLRDRTYEHGAKVISGKPITLGHGYSTLAWIPEAEGSWALPLRHDRISSHETPISRAVLQLKQVCRHLDVRPITVWDADYPMTIILVKRKGKKLSQRTAQPMWLAWIGEEELSSIDLWELYLRRFTIEHWNRFIKQRLHWTLPKLGTTEKGQRWSNLIPIMTWQLWLEFRLTSPQIKLYSLV